MPKQKYGDEKTVGEACEIIFEEMELFEITEPKGEAVPIILSVPHAGTKFPREVKRSFKTRMRRHLDDTDWFVHRLYDFAPEMGITMIKANLSRWVVDLNRDPASKPLYNDSRLITGITPTTDFFGNPLYKGKEREPDVEEIDRRLKKYYDPYHAKIQDLLDGRLRDFGKVLLWDAHSIRHLVSTIQKEPFPDMILGNNDGKTADPALIEVALDTLRAGKYAVNHNEPFKGGHITRSHGNPKEGVHALQLEMNKILYMDDSEVTYNQDRAAEVKTILRNTFAALIETMKSL